MKKIILPVIILLLCTDAVFGQEQNYGYNSVFFDLTAPAEWQEEMESLISLLKGYPDISLLEEPYKTAVTGIDSTDSMALRQALSWDDHTSDWKIRCSEWGVQAVILHRIVMAESGLKSEVLWIDGVTGIVSRDIISHDSPGNLDTFFLALGSVTVFDPALMSRITLVAEGDPEVDLRLELDLEGLKFPGREERERRIFGERPGRDDGRKEKDETESPDGEEAGTERDAETAGPDAPGEFPADGPEILMLKEGVDGTEFNAFFLDFTAGDNRSDMVTGNIEKLKELLGESGKIVLANERNIRELLREQGYRQPRRGLDLGEFSFIDPNGIWIQRAVDWGLRYIILFQYTKIFDRDFVDWVIIDTLAEGISVERTGLSGGYGPHEIHGRIASRREQNERRWFDRPEIPEPAGRPSGQPGDREEIPADLADLPSAEGDTGFKDGGFSPGAISSGKAGYDDYNTFIMDLTEEDLRSPEQKELIDDILAGVFEIREFKPARHDSMLNELDNSGIIRNRKPLQIKKLDFGDPVGKWGDEAEGWDVRYIILLRLTESFGRRFMEWTLHDMSADASLMGRIGIQEDFSPVLVSEELDRARKELAGMVSAAEPPVEEEKAAVEDSGVDFSLHLFGRAGYPLQDLAVVQGLTAGGGVGISVENYGIKNLGLCLMGDYGLALMTPAGIESLSYITGRGYVSFRQSLGGFLSGTILVGGGVTYTTGEYSGDLEGAPDLIDGMSGIISAGALIRLGGGKQKLLIMPTFTYYLETGSMMEAGLMAGFSLF